MSFQSRLLLVLPIAISGLIAVNSLKAVENANWPSWRGPQDNGSIPAGEFPTNWSVEEVSWTAPLPGKGCSTPIIWNDHIYLTAPVEGKDAVLAFDSKGTELWRTTFGDESRGKHRNGSGSNASPVTDGDGIFVYFKSGTLAALNLDGTIRWKTNLVEQYGPDTLFWDHGTSPVLTKDNVVMTRMHNGESWLAAFDKQSGDMKWKVARNFTTPTEGDHGYTTPLVIEHEGREALLVWGAEHVTVHNASDGKVTWSCGGFNPDANALWPAIATPVISMQIAVIATGRNDRGIPRLHGIKLEGSGDVTETNHVWIRDDIGTFVPTPVEHRGRVYLVRDRGEVECIDPQSGETQWSDTFPKNRASFYASPLIAGDKLYAPREDGTIFVADISNGFKLLAEIDMQESVIASMVPFGNRLLIRGEENLFCVQP
ncbi:MAG: Pyrrolo-quinoline quinone [Planctomycetaceae bacterium]|nr:Pyrrolo-quinoline quinone [Planctomycetaceae bacterium]